LAVRKGIQPVKLRQLSPKALAQAGVIVWEEQLNRHWKSPEIQHLIFCGSEEY